MRQVILLVCVLSLSACAMHPGSGGPNRATFTPSLSRMRRAAEDAATSPMTWAPAAVAGMLQIHHTDRHISHWFKHHHPIFGSRHTAQTASYATLGVSGGLYALSVAALPNGHQGWHYNARVAGIGAGSTLTTLGVTEGLKKAVGRQRPDQSNHASFPSGHASLTGDWATMTDQDIDRTALTPFEKFSLNGVSDSLAAVTDYARVSGRKHYPSDVLVGAALGHFIGVFADEAFIGASPAHFVPTVDLSRHGAIVGFASTF